MLEVKIEELTKAVIALTELIGKIEAGKDPMIDITNKALKVVTDDIQERVTVKEAVALAKEIDPKIKAETPAAPVMPAAPTFEPVVAEPAGSKAPFTDGKGLIDYVMTAYKEMGAERGAQIQGVLVEMGLQNVNELRPTEYDAFFAKVEALK
jgi:hypothetical protein